MQAMRPTRPVLAGWFERTYRLGSTNDRDISKARGPAFFCDTAAFRRAPTSQLWIAPLASMIEIASMVEMPVEPSMLFQRLVEDRVDH